MFQKKVKIPFVDYSLSVPLVEYHLGDGSIGYAVIDTGSESSLFDVDYVRKHRGQYSLEYTDEIIDVVGVQSKSETAIVNASAAIRLGEYVTTLTGMMVPMAHITDTICTGSKQKDIFVSALIGSDMLSFLNAKVDYKKNSLVIPL